MSYLKQLLWLTLGLIALFAILDKFNLTSWVLFPVSTLKGTNKSLTSTMGDSPSTAGA